MTRLLPLVLLAIPIASSAQQTPAPLPTRYQIWAGDVTGDGISDVVTWGSDDRTIRVRDGGPEGRELTSHVLENYPRNLVIADLDGDGKGEVVIGEGLQGYNRKDGPQTDVQLRIYRPLSAAGWSPVEVYRKASERPEVTSLQVVNVDGDRDPEIVFAYMASKYETHIAIADRVGGTWRVAEPSNVRMGMYVASGNVLSKSGTQLFVGRPYGDPPAGTTVAIGDLFQLEGTARTPVPSTRGVSSIALADIDGDGRKDVIMGDGWHSDYGKVARGRVAAARWVDGAWKYELIEDIPQSYRVQQIRTVDVDGDGREEVVVWATRRGVAFDGIVRLYQNARSGWRGVTLSDSTQGFAIGRSNGGVAVWLAGSAVRSVPIDLKRIAWDGKLAPAIETVVVDPRSLIGKAAPEIRADHWFGGKPTYLEDLAGKVVLIDFWATWCGPCIAAFPAMEGWLKEFGPAGFTIIGMTNLSSQTAETVRTFLEKRPLPWVVPLDETSRTHLAYGTGPLPHQVLIDRDGRVVAVFTGAGETLDQVAAEIRRLTAGGKGKQQ